MMNIGFCYHSEWLVIIAWEFFVADCNATTNSLFKLQPAWGLHCLWWWRWSVKSREAGCKDW